MDNTMLETCNGAMCLADLKAEEGQNLRDVPNDWAVEWEARRMLAVTQQEGGAS